MFIIRLLGEERKKKKKTKKGKTKKKEKFRTTKEQTNRARSTVRTVRRNNSERTSRAIWRSNQRERTSFSPRSASFLFLLSLPFLFFSPEIQASTRAINASASRALLAGILVSTRGRDCECAYIDASRCTISDESSEISNYRRELQS